MGAGFERHSAGVGGGQWGPRWAVGDPRSRGRQPEGAAGGGSPRGQPEGFRAGPAVKGLRTSTRVQLRFILVRGYITVWGVFHSFKWWVENIWQ